MLTGTPSARRRFSGGAVRFCSNFIFGRAVTPWRFLPTVGGLLAVFCHWGLLKKSPCGKNGSPRCGHFGFLTIALSVVGPLLDTLTRS